MDCRADGSECIFPTRLLLQWHVTERCNLRCRHCYQQDGKTSELEFTQLVNILDQYEKLLRHCRRPNSNSKHAGHITISGGEPFIRADFLEFLDLIAEHKERFAFSVLTNGTLIDRDLAARIADIHPRSVQVSIEGLEAVHDSIRGKGSYQQAVRGIEALVGAGVHTVISFTAHKNNYHDFPSVASLGEKLGVQRVWTDRLIPWGRGGEMNDQSLSGEETREFIEMLARLRQEARDRNSKTEMAAHRALQFLRTNERPYTCQAGYSLITIMPNGDLLPCRRMPIVVGNVLSDSLTNLYENSNLFTELRDRTRVPEACVNCLYAHSCRGGLKCLAYAIHGDPFREDPGCWIAQQITGFG